MLTFDEIWEMLTTQDESTEIEAKKASDMGKSILETISAFSNESGLGGGYLLLGIKSAEDSQNNIYEIEGLAEPDKIQRDLACQCREVFNIPIRPQIETITKEGKTVIVAFIPEAQPSEKPVYITKRGLPKGAFRRIGSTDQKCTERDLELFYQERSNQTFDQTPVKDASLDDFESQAIDAYRRIRKQVNPNASELNYSDRDLLDSLYAITKHPNQKGEYCPTVAGLILFGKEIALRKHFPLQRVDYIVVEGKEWVENPDKRYQSVIEIRQPLLLAIPRLTALVLNDLPKAFNLPEDQINRQDIPLIPSAVIREAIVNAVMHRDYRIRSPIQIIRYSDRLELRNAGYSLKSIDELDQPSSKTRNEKIAETLHELNIAETKGFGIRTMLENMRQANLTIPLFESSREKDSFCLTLFTHHFLEQEDIDWLTQFKDLNLSKEETNALVVIKKTGKINNSIYRYVNDVDINKASKQLIKLRDLGLINQNGKSIATYYTIKPEFLSGQLEKPYQDSSTDNQDTLSGQSEKPYQEDNTGNQDTLSGQLEKPYQDSSTSQQGQLTLDLFPPLSKKKLEERLNKIGKRTEPEEMKSLILELCRIKPYSSSELEKLLKRKRKYLLEQYLKPLIDDKLLEYTNPNSPNDPHQTYRTKQ